LIPPSIDEDVIDEQLGHRQRARSAHEHPVHKRDPAALLVDVGANVADRVVRRGHDGVSGGALR
jgi:hypothetical protein